MKLGSMFFVVMFLLGSLISSAAGQTTDQPLLAPDDAVIQELIQIFPVLLAEPYNWQGNVSEKGCSFFSISCSQGHIVSLMAHVVDPGYLPTSINNLTSLRLLNWFANWTQPIPDLSGAPLLEAVQLQGVDTITAIPQPFPLWALSLPLTSLQLAYFNFQGETIPSFASQSNIQTLDLQYCNLTGTIPDLSASAPNLKSLLLTGNRLTGTIPSWLNTNNCPRMILLDVSSNLLSGTIPPMGSSGFLNNIFFDHNNFEGNVSDAFVELTNLFFCSVSYNAPTLICPSAFHICCDSYIPGQTSTTSSSTALIAATTATLSVTSTSAATAATAATTTQTTTTTTSNNGTTNGTSSGTDTSTGTGTGPIATSTTTAPVVTNTGTGGCSQCECSCSSNISALITTPTFCSGGIWAVAGTAIISNTTLFVGQMDNLLVGGSVVQAPTGDLQICVNATRAGQITAGDTAQISGNLIILLTSKLKQNLTATIIKASQVYGTFQSATVVQKFSDTRCRKTIPIPLYSDASVSVLISQTHDQNCENEQGMKIWIPIVVCVGVLIIVSIIVIIVVVIIRARRAKAYRLQESSFPDEYQDDSYQY